MPEFTSADGVAGAGAGSNFPDAKRPAASLAAADVKRSDRKRSDGAAAEHAAVKWLNGWLND